MRVYSVPRGRRTKKEVVWLSDLGKSGHSAVLEAQRGYSAGRTGCGAAELVVVSHTLLPSRPPLLSSLLFPFPPSLSPLPPHISNSSSN
jgi:hypothetical protein